MQLTVCRAQIHEVELTADRPPRRQPQTAIVESERSQPSNRFDHDSLTARLAKHLGNAIAVSHKRSAGWSTANAGSGAFRRHRARRFLLDTPSLKQGLGLPDGHAQRLCAGNLSVRAYRCL